MQRNCWLLISRLTMLNLNFDKYKAGIDFRVDKAEMIT